jgi:hypothetical protein
MNTLFEFAYLMTHHTDLPVNEATYHSIISWKLGAIVEHVSKCYWKCKKFEHVRINTVPLCTLMQTISQERENYKAYLRTKYQHQLMENAPK